MISILVGGTAGSTSWEIVYMMDVIKSQIQSSLPLSSQQQEHQKIYTIIKEILKENNGSWKGLYYGLGITVVRAFLVNAAIFFGLWTFIFVSLIAPSNNNNNNNNVRGVYRVVRILF